MFLWFRRISIASININKRKHNLFYVHLSYSLFQLTLICIYSCGWKILFLVKYRSFLDRNMQEAINAKVLYALIYKSFVMILRQQRSWIQMHWCYKRDYKLEIILKLYKSSFHSILRTFLSGQFLSQLKNLFCFVRKSIKKRIIYLFFLSRKLILKINSFWIKKKIVEINCENCYSLICSEF